MEEIISKLKSRKFWATFGVLVVVLFGDNLGIHLEEAEVWQAVSTLLGYLGVQGVLDYRKGN